MSTPLREELGDFSSVVCLKAIITGMDEKTTAIALFAAGRIRGRQISEQLKLSTSDYSLEEITQMLAAALGKNGTRLLILDRLEKTDTGFLAYTRETVCSAGEEEGSSRSCTFTLGAVQGVLEMVTGQRFQAKHIESVLRGSSCAVAVMMYLNTRQDNHNKGLINHTPLLLAT